MARVYGALLTGLALACPAGAQTPQRPPLPELLQRAGRYADRLSINIELPTEQGLAALAPEKDGAAEHYIFKGELAGATVQKPARGTRARAFIRTHRALQVVQRMSCH